MLRSTALYDLNSKQCKALRVWRLAALSASRRRFSKLSAWMLQKATACHCTSYSAMQSLRDLR